MFASWKSSTELRFFCPPQKLEERLQSAEISWYGACVQWKWEYTGANILMATGKSCALCKDRIITFNHSPIAELCGLLALRFESPPPSTSSGKISFTRPIAEQAHPTCPYKSFFNQKPERLGADTHRSTTVTSQLLPVHLCSPGSVCPLLFFTVGLSAFGSVIRKLREMTTHQHFLYFINDDAKKDLGRGG